VTDELITFSFGENWEDFLTGVSKDDFESARQDIVHWIGPESVAGKRVVDVGSGSGIHSLAFSELGAAEIHSLDNDPNSVNATKSLWQVAGEPDHWTVEHASILDESRVQSLGQFDLVYSWGVLHHTGSMWQAIENTYLLVAPGGTLWLSIYQKGPRYESDLALKRRYNASSRLGKRYLEARRIAWYMLRRLRHGKNPFGWNERLGRGMNVYNDIVDWLGGLPYETATEDEMVRHAREHGFVLERAQVKGEGSCSIYVFSLPA
jgi:2-polyprenyl-6-hydroxyphenyl methylase/3-demethylubiquinone-9 3-methyltransferase